MGSCSELPVIETDRLYRTNRTVGLAGETDITAVIVDDHRKACLTRRRNNFRDLPFNLVRILRANQDRAARLPA